MPNRRWIDGRRRSASTSSTRCWNSCAMVSARLAAVRLLPSPLFGLVTMIARSARPFSAALTRVRSERYCSAASDWGAWRGDQPRVELDGHGSPGARRVGRGRCGGSSRAATGGTGATAALARPAPSPTARRRQRAIARVRCMAPSRSAFFNMFLNAAHGSGLLHWSYAGIRGISPSTGTSNSFSSARESWTERSRNSRPSAAPAPSTRPGDDGQRHDLQRLRLDRRVGEVGGVEHAEALAALLARHVFGHARVVVAGVEIGVAGLLEAVLAVERGQLLFDDRRRLDPVLVLADLALGAARGGLQLAEVEPRQVPLLQLLAIDRVGLQRLFPVGRRGDLRRGQVGARLLDLALQPVDVGVFVGVAERAVGGELRLEIVDALLRRLLRREPGAGRPLRRRRPGASDRSATRPDRGGPARCGSASRSTRAGCARR